MNRGKQGETFGKSNWKEYIWGTFAQNNIIYHVEYEVIVQNVQPPNKTTAMHNGEEK